MVDCSSIKVLADHPVGQAPEFILSDADRRRLAELKVSLDQCWDFLRQRRALREFGLDDDAAAARRPEVVENYEQ